MKGIRGDIDVKPLTRTEKMQGHNANVHPSPLMEKIEDCHADLDEPSTLTEKILRSHADVEPLQDQEKQGIHVGNGPSHLEQILGDGDPSWAHMLSDVLVCIFKNLPLEDILRTISYVCQTWQNASQDAVCWQNVDLAYWSLNKHPMAYDRMLSLVVSRSQGGLREIHAPNLGHDDMLRAIACSASQLQVLRIPYSVVSDECMCELAPKFASLTYLDMTAFFVSVALVEALGKHCGRLMRLNCGAGDGVAFAIARCMPQLKHLELKYDRLSNTGLKALLDGCAGLEYLDIRGCWLVDVRESFIQEATARLKFFYPPVQNENFRGDISGTDISFDAYDYYDEDVV